MALHDPVLRDLVERVRSARRDGTPLDIRGGGTKAFYGGARSGAPLEVGALSGITSYEPTELVITARAGTPVAEVDAALEEKGQCRAFEPPCFGPGGTVGGMVAAGLSGPSRAAVGSVRDHVLGTTLLTGRGEVLTFGGQVMKNVAGYDVSRLMAGSLGILGIVCEVSLKVVPRPAATATLTFATSQAEALTWCGITRRQPLPIRATAWARGRLRVRLDGASAAVDAAVRQLGGAQLDADEATRLWEGLRDHRDPFFDGLGTANDGERLWRLSVPATTAALPCADEPLIEWAGAQRWYRTEAPAARMRQLATEVGGHATLFRGADPAGPFAAVPDVAMKIHRRLKDAFDPDHLFNRGRLYADL